MARFGKNATEAAVGYGRDLRIQLDRVGKNAPKRTKCHSLLAQEGTRRPVSTTAGVRVPLWAVGQ
jgi:hypothetical protein